MLPMNSAGVNRLSRSSLSPSPQNARSGARRRTFGASTANKRTRLATDPPPRSTPAMVVRDKPVRSASRSKDHPCFSRRWRACSPNSRARSETGQPEVERIHYRHKRRHGADTLLKPLDRLRANADPGSKSALRPPAQAPRLTQTVDQNVNLPEIIFCS